MTEKKFFYVPQLRCDELKTTKKFGEYAYTSVHCIGIQISGKIKSLFRKLYPSHILLIKS